MTGAGLGVDGPGLFGFGTEEAASGSVQFTFAADGASTVTLEGFRTSADIETRVSNEQLLAEWIPPPEARVSAEHLLAEWIPPPEARVSATSVLVEWVGGLVFEIVGSDGSSDVTLDFDVGVPVDLALAADGSSAVALEFLLRVPPTLDLAADGSSDVTLDFDPVPPGFVRMVFAAAGASAVALAVRVALTEAIAAAGSSVDTLDFDPVPAGFVRLALPPMNGSSTVSLGVNVNKGERLASDGSSTVALRMVRHVHISLSADGSSASSLEVARAARIRLASDGASIVSADATVVHTDARLSSIGAIVEWVANSARVTAVAVLAEWLPGDPDFLLVAGYRTRTIAARPRVLVIAARPRTLILRARTRNMIDIARELKSDPERIELATHEDLVYGFEFADRIKAGESLDAVIAMTFTHIESDKAFPAAFPTLPSIAGSVVHQRVIGSPLIAQAEYSMTATVQIGGRQESMETIVAVYF